MRHQMPSPRARRIRFGERIRRLGSRQDETYTREAARRLRETVPESERVIAPPAAENLKAAKWRLAVDLVAQASSPASPGSVPLPEATPGAATGESTAVPPAEPPPPTAESASDRSADRRVRANLCQTARPARRSSQAPRENHRLLSSPTNPQSADNPARTSDAGGDETRGLGGPRSVPAPDLVLNRHCPSASSATAAAGSRWRRTISACWPA